jgi:toxin ParE1/3/4
VVRWTGHALAQLPHIHDDLAQDSPRYAKRVTDALVRKVAELDEESVRKQFAYSYRILYEIKVRYKRQELQPEMIER